MKEDANLKVQGNTNKMLIKQYWDLAPIDLSNSRNPKQNLQPIWIKTQEKRGFVSQHIKQ